jgi:hypothetical protein
MKQKLLTIVSLLASTSLSVFSASPAHAAMVAGWDLSQYFADGILSVDGAEYTGTLSANYSDLDPTQGAGTESAAFGSLYLDGQFGSTNVQAGSGTEPILPSGAVGGSLSSNLGAPGGLGGSLEFDTHSILAFEGQAYTNFLALTAADLSSAVFAANLSAVPELGSDWSVSFGARTFSGAGAIGIAFSTDGVNYTNLGSTIISSLDTLYSVNLSAIASDTAFVRFDFAAPGAGGVGQAFIDNIAINANLVPIPEPGTVLLYGFGMIGLAFAGRRGRNSRA